MTRPDDVIKPLPTLWLGLGGDGFLGYFSPGVTDSFLEGQSSFSLAFLFGAPFLATLGVEGAPSFPVSTFLYVAAALTNALYLAASIFAKDK